MMKYILLVCFAIALAPVFQNCAVSSDVGGTSSDFSLDAIYPYSTKPTFYDSVQLIDVAKDGNGWAYQFIVGMVHIDNPAQKIDIEVQIYDQDGKLLCPRFNAQVNNENNNVIIDDCASGAKVLSVSIKLLAKLPTETNLQLIKEYQFLVP